MLAAPPELHRGDPLTRTASGDDDQVVQSTLVTTVSADDSGELIDTEAVASTWISRDTVMEESAPPRDGGAPAESPTVSSMVSAAFSGTPEPAEADHLVPTEETCKKLELSLDELIERGHVPVAESANGDRAAAHRSRRGCRRGSLYHPGTGHPAARNVSVRRPGMPTATRFAPPLHFPRHAVDGSTLLLPHPSAAPYAPTLPYSPVTPRRGRIIVAGAATGTNGFVGSPPAFSPTSHPAPHASLPNGFFAIRATAPFVPTAPFGVPAPIQPYRHPRRSRLEPYPVAVDQKSAALERSSLSNGTRAVGFPGANGSTSYSTGRYARGSGADALALAEDSALAETEIYFPPMNEDGTSVSADNSLVVKFKNTEVLTVRKSRGDLVLSSGGWKTLSTRLVLNNALKPLGLWIESHPPAEGTTSANGPERHGSGDVDMGASNEGSAEKNTAGPDPSVKSGSSEKRARWTVVDGKFYLATFQDGMVIGQIGASSRAQLMARASVVAQHLKQMKNNALMRRQRNSMMTRLNRAP